MQQLDHRDNPERIMSTMDHLSELRRRIIWVLVVFVLALVLGFVFSMPIVELLKQDPIAQHVPWNVFKVTDAFRVYIQFSFILSLVITLPFLLYQVWAFMKPGLTDEERRATLTLVPLAALLFVLGILFGYKILFPIVFTFMGTITESLGAQEMYGISEYFSFMINIVFPVALLFELPVVIMFLTRIGVLNPMAMKKARKYAYLALAILSAIVTPPDFISQTILFIPLIVLFEISVGLSAIVYRRKLAREQKRWESYNEN